VYSPPSQNKWVGKKKEQQQQNREANILVFPFVSPCPRRVRLFAHTHVYGAEGAAPFAHEPWTSAGDERHHEWGTPEKILFIQEMRTRKKSLLLLPTNCCSSSVMKYCVSTYTFFELLELKKRKKKHLHLSVGQPLTSAISLLSTVMAELSCGRVFSRAAGAHFTTRPS
jgi:hypothetical protein